jgi:hypothetical protein
MTVDLVTMTKDQLKRRQAEVLAGIDDVDDLKERAERDALSPDERDQLAELSEVEFLLGHDA